ncbi:glycosyltransferase [Ferribacterium limneticum]|uniref:glycosyltransferase n=1 Tax=Ferribacterium limneticum TaxID=76259 RepID=UPI001CF92152|nr:glycosyltransferase [Ferribacterium limneticum]UCV26664.1 glycosyltransferase [Ferribacterium limneticum]UCV30581.1 glycosyltransferase [Ferribacterium limneticum]
MTHNRKILLVTPSSPFSPQSGAEQRTALLYEALLQLGQTDVLLVSPTDLSSRVSTAKDDRIIAELLWKKSRFGISKYAPQTFSETEGAPRKPDYRQYDMIVGRYLNPICKLHLPRDIPTIVDLDDWQKSYGTDNGFSPSAVAQRLKQTYAAWLAKRQLGRFNGFFFVSERDRNSEPQRLSATLPNIPFAPPKIPLPDNVSSNILFVGALWYAPNSNGIDHFLANCWPRIRSAVPTATLSLIGAAPQETRKNWEKHPGVSAPGFVDDLGDAYRSAAFTIAPIYFGGGTNIKVVESLAFGRACVTTPHCASAFESDLVAGKAISVAADDDTFVDHCITMLSNPARRHEQAEIGHQIVSTIYNRDTFTRKVLDLADKVLVARAPILG